MLYLILLCLIVYEAILRFDIPGFYRYTPRWLPYHDTPHYGFSAARHAMMMSPAWAATRQHIRLEREWDAAAATASVCLVAGHAARRSYYGGRSSRNTQKLLH